MRDPAWDDLERALNALWAEVVKRLPFLPDFDTTATGYGWLDRLTLPYWRWKSRREEAKFEEAVGDSLVANLLMTDAVREAVEKEPDAPHI